MSYTIMKNLSKWESHVQRRNMELERQIKEATGEAEAQKTANLQALQARIERDNRRDAEQAMTTARREAREKERLTARAIEHQSFCVNADMGLAVRIAAMQEVHAPTVMLHPDEETLRKTREGMEILDEIAEERLATLRERPRAERIAEAVALADHWQVSK